MKTRLNWLLFIPAIILFFGFTSNTHAEYVSSPTTECQPYLAKDTAKLNRGGNRIYNKNATSSVWVVCPVTRINNSMSLGTWGYTIRLNTAFNSLTFPYYNIGMVCTYKNLNPDGSAYYTKSTTIPYGSSSLSISMPWWADDSSLTNNYWTLSCKLPPESAIYGITNSFVGS